MYQVFERLDVEGNGVISENELQQVVQQEGLGNLQEDVVRLLQGIDIDGSNSLNYREFLAATMEASYGRAGMEVDVGEGMGEGGKFFSRSVLYVLREFPGS